jgi:hypothetical protein
VQRLVPIAAAIGLLAALVPTAGGAAPECATTVTTATAAVDAVAKASGGDVVCLADGRYEPLALASDAAPPGVTVRAQHPGRAIVAGATLDGTHITLAQLRITGQVTIGLGSVGMTVDHNLLVGQGPSSQAYGVFVCPATPPDHCDDISITGNRFVGRFDEDVIRANVYRDGPDEDPYGLLIEGNEFTGNVEYGGHNDVLQTVWVGDHLVIRGNYLHDFGGQGLFVKDQATEIDGFVLEDNLIVRQGLPCDPDRLCPDWQLSPLQLFGPIANGSIRHNTVWPTTKGQRKPGGTVLLRERGWTNVTYADNVIDDGAREAATTLTGAGNTHCTVAAGVWRALPGSTKDCAPAFLDPAHGDYRRSDGRGVTWRVADRHFGPGGPPTTADGGSTRDDLAILLGAALVVALAIAVGVRRLLPRWKRVGQQ